jgi:hypothetical protein
MNHASRAIALAAGLALPAAALAVGPIEVIYSKKPGHPTSVLPGAVDLTGAPEVTAWKAIEDLVVSPDGSRWMVKSRSTTAETHNSGIVMGSGTTGSIWTISTASGPFVMQEGQPAPFGNASDWFDFVASAFGRWDDNGNLVFGFRARTTQTGSTAAADAMRAVKWNGTTATLAFKQGDLYTNLQDIPANPSGDETVGNSANSFHLLNDGRVGSSDLTIGNISTLRRPAVTYNLDFFKQVQVSTVGGFGGGPDVTWFAMDSNSFYTTPDGAHWWMTGRHTNSSTGPRIFAYDGQIVLEAAQTIPGSSVVMGDVFQVNMASNGDYIARGRDNSGTTAAAPDWVFRNGTLIAKTGDPITPGNAETWGDTILAVATNAAGDYVIIGNTSAKAASDSVVVLNGTTVVMREGDPVDLDGNGQFDDDAFIGRGVNTNAAFGASTNNGSVNWWLTNDLMLYGILMLRDGAGNDINVVPAFGTPQAFIRIDLSSPAACYANCDGSTTVPVLNVQDFACFLNAFASGESYANCDGSTTVPVLNVQDFACFLNAFAAGCP